MKRKQSMACLIAAVLLAVLAVPCVSAAQEPYSLLDALSGGTAQGPEWYYMGRVNGGDWQELHYTAQWGDNWQISANPEGDNIYFSLYSDGNAKLEAGNANGQKVDIAAMFKAPEDGTLVIAPWRHIAYNGWTDIGDDGSGGLIIKSYNASSAVCSILHNGNVLYSAGINGEIQSSGELTVEVKAGDTIWFTADPGDTEFVDIHANDIMVAYEGAPFPEVQTVNLREEFSYAGEGVYSLHDAYMSATQGPEWFYMYRYGEDAWTELNYYPDWGINWQVSTQPSADGMYWSMCDWYGVCAQAGFDPLDEIAYQVAAVFSAPQDGELLIAPWQHVLFSDCSQNANGEISYSPYPEVEYAAMILKNDELIYFRRLSGGYQVSPELSLEVKAGDRLYFVFNPLGFDQNSAGMGGANPTVRMDDIRVGYKGAVFGELPAIVADTTLSDPPAKPGDPEPDSSGSGAQNPDSTQSPDDNSTPPPTAAQDSSGGSEDGDESPGEGPSPILIIAAIAGAAVIIAALVFILMRKKK